MPATVTFWGVRGSIPTPTPANLGVGGNTSCVEIRSGDDVVILDAGTGIRECGNRLLRENGHAPRDVSVVFSHFHWDHLQGLPFFGPLYRPDFRLRIVSACEVDATRERLRGLMQTPYFPVDWESTAASKRYERIGAAGLTAGGIRLQTVPLNHPQGAAGYRVETSAGTVVYASDLEHGDAELDAALLEAARGANLLIYDAQYTPAEYESGRRGWGHSTWAAAARLACQANVGKLVLFHHDPGHDDQAMAEIESEAQKVFANTEVAKESHSITV